MCNLFGIIAHTKCRKTCKLCIQDKPKPRSKAHSTTANFLFNYGKLPVLFKAYGNVLHVITFLYSLALHATLKEFKLTLTQNGPLAPTFLTMCVDSAASGKYGLPDSVLSVVVHAYGDVSDDTCENFGPHFNPFGVSNEE